MINVNISIQAESRDGGEVTMPLEDTFWEAYFGMFTDKFGVHWMINYSYNQE